MSGTAISISIKGSYAPLPSRLYYDNIERPRPPPVYYRLVLDYVDTCEHLI